MVAALTMTSEREEVIDFVAPYFEQSGILIGKQIFVVLHSENCGAEINKAVSGKIIALEELIF